MEESKTVQCRTGVCRLGEPAVREEQYPPLLGWDPPGGLESAGRSLGTAGDRRLPPLLRSGRWRCGRVRPLGPQGASLWAGKGVGRRTSGGPFSAALWPLLTRRLWTQSCTMGKRDNRVVSTWWEKQWGDAGAGGRRAEPLAFPDGA